MRKKVVWNNIVRLAWLGVLGGLLAACAKLIPNNTWSLGISAIGILIGFGSSLTGLYLLKKNRV